MRLKRLCMLHLYRETAAHFFDAKLLQLRLDTMIWRFIDD